MDPPRPAGYGGMTSTLGRTAPRAYALAQNGGTMGWALVERLGERTVSAWRSMRGTAAMAAALCALAVQPRRWSQPVRNVLARQILFTGVDALPVVSGVAVLIGLSVVLQIHVQLTRFG